MPAISALADVTGHNSFTKGVLTSSDLNNAFGDIQDAIADLNDVAADLEDHHAGSSAPSDNAVRGKLWADTTNSGRVVLKLDPDGSGADDEVLTRLEAYRISLATGGTGTHKVSGRLTTDSTSNSAAGSTGVLTSYTLPADTLDADAKLIYVVAWGTKSGANATASLQVRFNAAAQHTHTVAANATDWFIERWIVRTGASTQDFASVCSLNRDDTGATDLVGTGTDAEDLTTNLAIDINVSSINASDTITQEVLAVIIFH